MDKRTIEDLDVHDKRVLVRVDFNVPLREEAVADDTRLRAALPTLSYLIEGGARSVLCSHLGRPKGRVDPALSLKPVARRLGELLGQEVAFAEDCVGEAAESAVERLQSGGILLLENTRFHPEEKANDPGFAQQLSRLADLYVNDAFGSAHRAHASTEGVAHHLPSAAGYLMTREIENLNRAVQNPMHPYVAILGGAKISDKIGVVRSFLDRADQLLIGGGMANTFLAAEGYDMAESLVEVEVIDKAREILQEAAGKLLLPSDLVVADAFEEEAEKKTVRPDSIPRGWRALDIGPETVETFRGALQGAKMVVWNGPMGVFEFPPFAQGTRRVAEEVASLEAVTIIGGGDSAAAVNQAGLADRMTHVSTGGGASLAVLEGKTLPGLAALDDR